MHLTDAVAVVTGASSGLGALFARDLVQRGARVFGLARRAEVLQALSDELGDAFVPVPCDVTQEDAVAESFAHIDRVGGGRVDILINNAGLGRFAPVDELPLADWDLQMDTNLRGVFLCTRAAVPFMKRQNADAGFGGHIVNIASVAGLLGNPSISAYNVTKFGLRGMSEALFKELRGDGIKVTCVYPGSIETNFFEEAGIGITSNPMQPEDVSATVMHVLEGPDNYLISEVVMRPLRPRG
ncbi:MAG: SDR family oxidoreductase [Bacteroidota bacterium]